MREQLQQYVALLFAGVKDCEEIQQEILQNTLDRYDDLIAQGKVPEAAYRLAISGIGDINEILGTPSQNKTAVLPPMPSVQTAEEEDLPRKKLLRAIAVGLYILSLAPLLLFPGAMGVCLLLVLVAAATVLMILGGKPGTAAASTAHIKVQKHSAKDRNKNWLTTGIAGIVCIILLAVLLLILVGSIASRRYNMEAVPMTQNVVEDVSRTATLGKKATIYNSPSDDPGAGAHVNGELEAGTEITIQHQENVGNKLWAYVSAPIQGWMVLEDHAPEAAPDADPYAAIEEVVMLPVKTTVYGAPSVESGANIGELEAGTEVSITRRELIGGKTWAFIILPTNGWIPAANLEAASFTEPSDLVAVTEPAAPVENTMPVQIESSGIFIPDGDMDSLTSLSIDWIAGDVHVLAGDVSTIILKETEGDQLLDWQMKNGKLSIDFCEKSLMKGLRMGGVKAKNLTVTVPRNWVGRELEIDAASSNLVMQDLTVQKVEIDAASGRTEFINCDLSSLDAETASGDIYFVGYMDVLECETVSGNFIGTVNNSPRSIEMESASGSLELTIPADTGFTVRIKGIKNVFSAQDFQMKKQNGAYIHGDGACKIEMESVGGGVLLQKAK